MTALILLYVLAWPVPIEPQAWTPPKTPTWKANDALAKAHRLSLGGLGDGPEDVAIDAQGRLYGGLLNGKVVRLAADGSAPEVFADTGGRPLGLDFDASGNLWIADAQKGLLRVSADGVVTVVVTEHGGLPFRFTDDVDVAASGKVYFTDASHRFGIEHYTLDLLEHRPSGRLLVYDPKTKALDLLLDGLYFANGVAVSPDESFVLVCETGTYCVQRVWLKGPKKGTHERFVENLPGFPDGISSNGRGTYWLALAAPRDALLDDVLLPRPFLRKVLVRLPQFVQPVGKRHAWVLGLTADGKIVHDLQDKASDSHSPLTSVEEHAGKLYLGSLERPEVAWIPVPK